jgi:hypothetical protein
MLDLLQFSVLDGLPDQLGRRGKPVRPDRSQSFQLVIINVVAVALGERIEKHRTPGRTVGDNHPEPTGTTLAGPRHALLDKAAAKIGVDNAPLGPLDRLTQAGVGNALPASKPLNASGQENPHGTSLSHHKL